MVKRVTDDTKKPQKEQIIISESTTVYFSLKTLFASIAFILGVVFGFYRLVVEPKLEDLDRRYYMMYSEQKEMYSQIIIVNNNLIELKSSLKNFTRSLETNGSTYYLSSNETTQHEILLNSSATVQTQSSYNHEKMFPSFLEFLHKQEHPVVIPLSRQ